jgi:hypothetical protein
MRYDETADVDDTHRSATVKNNNVTPSFFLHGISRPENMISQMERDRGLRHCWRIFESIGFIKITIYYLTVETQGTQSLRILLFAAEWSANINPQKLRFILLSHN